MESEEVKVFRGKDVVEKDRYLINKQSRLESGRSKGQRDKERVMDGESV